MSKGVLLLAHGAPDSTEDIRDFYMEMTGGKIPDDETIEKLTKRYEAIGGQSPMLDIMQKKAQKLEELLGDEYQVYFGMRNSEPFIQDAIEEMDDNGITHAVAIPMVPQYSNLNTEKYFKALDEANENIGEPVKFLKIQSWNTLPKYIDALVERLEEGFALPEFKNLEREEISVIFTSFTLPETTLEHDDPYPDEISATTTAITARTGHANWHFAYQGNGYLEEPGLGPDLLEKIKELAENGESNILVCPAGFVIDDLDTLYDIDIEAKEVARNKGINLKRVKTLNEHPKLIEGFAEMVQKASIWKQMH